MIAPTTLPRIEAKWTILNDEWVQVLREITRGQGGRSDRPAGAPDVRR